MKSYKNINVIHQGRGGYIECEGFRFDIEMMANGPTFAIYFPRRKYDKKIARIREQLEVFVATDPLNYEISDYDSPHNLYGGMTVNERLCIAEVMDDYETAIACNDYNQAACILADLDLDQENIQAIVAEERRRKG